MFLSIMRGSRNMHYFLYLSTGSTIWVCIKYVLLGGLKSLFIMLYLLRVSFVYHNTTFYTSIRRYWYLLFPYTFSILICIGLGYTFRLFLRLRRYFKIAVNIIIIWDWKKDEEWTYFITYLPIISSL